jgi:hypothetical protein
MVHKLLTVPEHLSSHPVLCGVHVTRSLALCYVLYLLLFAPLSFFFWPLCCLPMLKISFEIMYVFTFMSYLRYLCFISVKWRFACLRLVFCEHWLSCVNIWDLEKPKYTCKSRNTPRKCRNTPQNCLNELAMDRKWWN